MKKILIVIVGMMFFVAACAGTSTQTIAINATNTHLPPTATATLQPTLTPTETFTPSPTATPTEAWIQQGPGDVTVPIIVYHRIDYSPIDSRYYVTPEKFEEQMKLLHDWGYSSITTTMLIDAIIKGIELPPRPFLFTVDDGNIDNYTNLFPIMQKYGFTGILYIVGNYIGAEHYMNDEQILEMYNAGWEVGSHSMNHFDLTKLDGEQLRFEIVGSKETLETRLGVPILTFAYPFGLHNEAAHDYIKFAGYIGAMGASGYTPAQGRWNLFYLQRVEIKGSEDAKTFTRFLPWLGDPKYLPTDTPTPGPAPSKTSSP